MVTEVDMEHKDVLHVRTMNYDYDKVEEIVIDSWADVSALYLFDSVMLELLVM